MRLQALGSLGVLLLVCITWTLLQSKPNVVIFFTDDQGTLDAGCYGAPYLKTPHIDQLAETGVRFTQAYAHTVCCPSRAMLMTGRHPQRGGVNHWTQGNMNTPKGRNMALEELTMAEVLKREGYRTALLANGTLGHIGSTGRRSRDLMNSLVSGMDSSIILTITFSTKLVIMTFTKEPFRLKQMESFFLN